jgi:hypothetical protein
VVYSYPVRFRDPLSRPSSGPLFSGPIYPGNGYPPRPGEDRPALSPFGRLAKNGNLGKSSILIYDRHANGPQASPVDMISIRGDDLDACQMVVTLHPPRVIPLEFDILAIDTQNLSGEQTNSEVSISDFIADDSPIEWPPLQALLEFGAGGTSSKVIVDFLNGVTVSVTASYLRVHALVTQTKDVFDIGGTSAAYYCAAHVGPGFAENHITNTVYAGILDDKKESGVIDIPKFAKRVQLFGARSRSDHPTVTRGWIRFFQSPDGSHPVGDVWVSDKTSRIVDVPNAAQYFSVINRSGHHSKMSVVFGLGL